MRAQAAIMEAFLAMAVLSAAISVIAAGAFNSASAGTALGTGQANAAYDLAMLALHNATANACIAEWSQPCVATIELNFISVYNLSYISVGMGPNRLAAGTEADCRSRYELCIPIEGNATAETLCTESCV